LKPVSGTLDHCFQVVYSLQELDGDDDMFSITTMNGKGIIRLTGQLDYERKFLYQLRILAVDRANNERVRNIILMLECWNQFVLKFMLNLFDFLDSQSVVQSTLHTHKFNTHGFVY